MAEVAEDDVVDEEADGVVANIVTIMILSRGKCGLSKNITHYLVAMATADLLVIIIDLILRHIPIAFWDKFIFLESLPVCNIHAVFLFAATDCSVWFTVTFTLDRFVSICSQKLKMKYCTERVAAAVLGTVTTLSCLKNISWYFMFSGKYWLLNNPWFCNVDYDVLFSQLTYTQLASTKDSVELGHKAFEWLVCQSLTDLLGLGTDCFQERIGLVILDPEEVTYIETQVKGVIGRSVVLECGQSLPTIYIWGFTRPGSSGIRAVLYDYGMGAKLQRMASMFGEVKVLSNSASLVIGDLQLAAEGRFTCQSLYDTDDGAKLVYVFVDLYVLVPITNPSVQMSTSAPVEGSTVSIVCSVENGTRPLEYIWNRQETLSRSPVNISETTSSQLNLTSVNRNHTGWYTCTARNEVNEATSNRVWLDVIYGPDQPAINITPYSLNSVGYSAIEQDTVSMICSASSNPPSQYIWFHNNSQIYAGQQFVIERISRSQTGTYMCLAHNTVLNTRTKTTIVLTILDTVSGDDRPGVSHGGRASSTESDPVVQKRGTEKRRAVVIGDSVVRGADRRFCGREKDTRMVCCLPDARVQDVSDWVHDILVREGKQPEVVIHVGTNDIGRKRDEVLKCEFRELGRRLKNRTSRVAFSGLLPVLRDRDDLPAGRPICTVLSVNDNQDIALWCSWEGGDPPATLQWVNMVSDGFDAEGRSSVSRVIPGQKTSHNSTYACKPSHPALRADWSCKTTALLPEGRPKCSATGVKNLAYTMLSCSWEGGLPQATLQWKDWRSSFLGKAERSINNQVLKSSPTYDGKEFICQATHPLTRSRSCNIQLEAPELLTPRNIVTVFEGSDVHLTCILRAAYPSSEITWHNNRNESIWLKPRKYLLHQEAFWSNLTVREIDGDNDNGSYWCTASNVVGSSTTGINLHVKKYPTPPNVTISKLLYNRQRTEVVLEWITRGSGDLTGFMVQRRPARRSFAGWGETLRRNFVESGTDTHIPWQVVANAIDPAVRGHKLGGLDPTVLYAFRILAVNHKTTGYPSEVKTPADPPFSALPAVIGAAVVGMLVAVAGTVLVFQYVMRNRENFPWLHDLLFQHELREQINHPEDAEAALPAEGEGTEGSRELTEEPSSGASGEEASSTPAIIEPLATSEQEDVVATEADSP
ncbi:V-set and immunoglobulin domain-containing protein 10-like 2 [Mobula hypostoma]|uniref:V-set and immunoglobulin domain-containing protein 10-like 2 n=1 Tax=Mobula hypostoma TaxID=723540 RepID=UPI002FC2C751